MGRLEALPQYNTAEKQNSCADVLEVRNKTVCKILYLIKLRVTVWRKKYIEIDDIRLEVEGVSEDVKKK